MLSSDIAVIGGGIVGLSIALGLQRIGLQVTIYDESDVAFRASRGNFGLVWVQGKGDKEPAYAHITRLSAKLWTGFADYLALNTGIDIHFSQKGGLYICLSKSELADRCKVLRQMADDHSEVYPFEVLDLQQLRELTPDIGPAVAGATWCPEDGHVNPLYLMRALLKQFKNLGGRLVNSGPVGNINPKHGDFIVQTNKHAFSHSKVIIAAGLGSKRLGEMVGINTQVSPIRGQVLIAERVKRFLKYPTAHVRQTMEGTVQCGDSHEDVGFNEGTSSDILARIARRSVTMFPLLKEAHLIRSWGALRIMTPDGLPIYQQSEKYPGAFVVTCHSGVTLAALHAGPIANWIASNVVEPNLHLERFHGDRF